jgi:hypothetical protein
MIMRPAGLRTDNDCTGATQPQFTRPAESLEIEARLTTLLCKNSLLQYPKKWKLDKIFQNLLSKAMDQKGLFCELIIIIIIMFIIICGMR